MRDIGYESHSCVKNLGSLSIFTALYFAKVAIIAVLWIPKRFTHAGSWPKYIKIYNFFAQTAFFSDILAILIDAYFEFLIAGYQQNYTNSKFLSNSRLL